MVENALDATDGLRADLARTETPSVVLVFRMAKRGWKGEPGECGMVRGREKRDKLRLP